MSDIRSWPVSLNHRPVKAGYRWRPHDAQMRTPMEQGPARKRRRWIDSPAYIEVSWPWGLNDFELFRAWHHAALGDGSRFFRVPVFTGASFSTLPCRFKGVYDAALQGLEWWVSAEIEVRQVPFLSADDYPEIADRQWPEAIDPLPIRDAYRLTPHRAVLRGDYDGPQDTRLWYEDGVASSSFQWPMSGDGFELFRAWYHVGLADGVSWFKAPVYVGGDYGTRVCRFADADGWSAELQADGMWLVQAQVETRDVPYMDDGAVYVLGTMGGEAYASLAAGIHQFVHETWPEATS